MAIDSRNPDLRVDDGPSISPEAVRAELERVLASRPFQTADALSRFLRFVVEQTLEGRAAGLKEYVLGTELFGRGESFDPRNDSIVRVEGSRLRTRLADYYAKNGLTSEIRIELPRGGYVPAFRRVATTSGAGPAPSAFLRVREWPPHVGRAALAAAALGVSVGAAALAWITPSALDAFRRRPPAVAQPSVAVLPFVNVGPDREDDYFSEGVAEEIADALGRLPGLRVAARSSAFRFRGAQADVREVARQLHVGAVVEGTVRRAGDRLRVTARLVDASEAIQLWSDTYDGRAGDIFAIQEQVARAVAGALRAHLPTTPSAARARSPDSTEAHDLLLKARYLAVSVDTAPAIIGYYQTALALDPGFAPAYTGMADTWVRLALAAEVDPRTVMEQARKAVDQALVLDEAQAAAHFVQAMIHWQYDWLWEEADREFRRALDLDANTASARVHYANYLASMNRLPEALQQAAQVSALDPLGPGSRAVEAQVYYLSRDYERTIRHCQAIISADADAWPLYYWLGRAYDSTGRPAQAVEALEKWRSRPARFRGRGFGMVAMAYARAGRRPQVLALLAELRERARRAYVSPASMAMIHMALGDNDAALTALEQAYVERDSGLVNLAVEPAFDPVRGDARFWALLDKLRLSPEALRQQSDLGRGWVGPSWNGARH